MGNKPTEGISRVIVIVLFVFIGLSFIKLATSTPYGPTLDYSTTITPGTLTSGIALNHTKGRITTLRLNATQPNDDWKGYVGNISGTLVLDDASNYTLYSWDLTTIAGEVYATRASSIPTWSNIACANSTIVSTENTAMGHGSDEDNITNTFNNGNHKTFVTAGTSFSANQCNYSQYMYVNDQSQSSSFSEVLLTDGSNLIYTSVLENNQNAYDNNPKDFEMILAENGDTSVNTAYYFYVELG